MKMQVCSALGSQSGVLLLRIIVKLIGVSHEKIDILMEEQSNSRS